MIKGKKGYALGDIQGIVLMLIVISFLFGAGLYVVSQFQNELSGFDTVWNESIADTSASNVTPFQIANPTGQVTILYVTNATGAYDLLEDGVNYNWTESGILTLIDADFNATALNISYTREIYNFTSYQAMGNVSSGVLDLATWIPIIIVIIAAAIIIGIVIRSFGAGQRVD